MKKDEIKKFTKVMNDLLDRKNKQLLKKEKEIKELRGKLDLKVKSLKLFKDERRMI